jgi:hypothetical protein
MAEIDTLPELILLLAGVITEEDPFAALESGGIRLSPQLRQRLTASENDREPDQPRGNLDWRTLAGV